MPLAALLFTLDPWAVLNSPAVLVVFGLIVTFVASRHVLHAAAAWLHADAAHRTGLAKALEDDAGGAADVLDDYLAKNQQDVKALADPTTRAAAEAHLLEQAKAEAKAVIDAKLAGGAAMLLIVCALGLGLPSCATSAAATVNVATNSLNATGKLFLTTASVLDAAYDAKMISEFEYQPWRDFSLRFKAAYAIADKALEAAAKSNDQTVQGVVQAEMATLMRELATFQALAAQVAHPTTGPPSGCLSLPPGALGGVL